ncbi:carboxypeptidase-like regulatory domain-containing protein [Eudoraea sp.]|uniref:carboxypeptidase-like regulatory domain-containing protein n=3 Tax=Eudoraea sp. TaxID=1979955 RepID=UPI003C71488D
MSILKQRHLNLYIGFFRYCTVLLCLAFTISVFSQEQDFINAKLIDSQTKEPVIFATIRIKDLARGVISNTDGGFKIPNSFKTLGNVLIISSMGYKSREILISELSSIDLNIIQLEARIFELSEAVVKAKRKRKLSAEEIVRRAIEAIPRNFPTNSFSTIGYYRDYQLDENSYVNLNEAILEVYDQGFYELDQETTRVEIYDYKVNYDFKRDTLAQQPYDYTSKRKTIDKAYLFNYGGNEFTILRIHDAIRNYKIDSYAYVHRLDTDLLNNHYFSKESETLLDDDVLYTIKFRKTYPGFSALGRLFISKKDYAIHKMEYAVYDLWSRKMDKKQKKRGNNKQLIFKIIVEYQKVDDLMYLNYISFQNRFQLFSSPFMVTDIIPDLIEKRFKVKFNNRPYGEVAQIRGNYRVMYKGKELTLTKIAVRDNTVLLYPDLDLGGAHEMFKEIDKVSNIKKIGPEFLNFEFAKEIIDVKGHHLNDGVYKEYNQFREFFVQQVKTQTNVPKDTLYMKKDRPIYKDQIIVKPLNFSDYWMNTPLQNIDK